MDHHTAEQPQSTTSAFNIISQNDPTTAKDLKDTPLHAGHTRFEIELEFAQSLSNPHYLNYLASQKLLDDPRFVAYLSYLHSYWRRPQYARFLSYPGPTLKALELLQVERFRKEILSPEMVARMVEGGMRAAVGE
ncbi:MAG: hypothetical protein M1831_000293 [Alyxoria varia]|nr:MAG: hypothetical protein M1831_000293 [Alyxoria varia]